MVKISLLISFKWWYQFYGKLYIPLSILLVLLCWQWLGLWGIVLAGIIDIIAAYFTVQRYRLRSFKEMLDMLEWLQLYWREAERWKELGVKELEQNLNDEAAAMFIKFGRRFGHDSWDSLIEYAKKLNEDKESNKLEEEE